MFLKGSNVFVEIFFWIVIFFDVVIFEYVFKVRYYENFLFMICFVIML